MLEVGAGGLEVALEVPGELAHPRSQVTGVAGREDVVARGVDLAREPLQALVAGDGERPLLVGGQRRAVVIEQVDREFLPYMTVVQTNTPVVFPNRDPIQHHVYSFSPAKNFEIKLYSGNSPQVLLDKPGMITLGCNIHDWMIAYIYVADSPYFAKTGSDGQAVLAALPAGRYRVHVWHPRMTGNEETTAKSQELAQEAVATVTWVLELKPEFRPRRAPVRGDPGYR